MLSQDVTTPIPIPLQVVVVGFSLKIGEEMLRYKYVPLHERLDILEMLHLKVFIEYLVIPYLAGEYVDPFMLMRSFWQHVFYKNFRLKIRRKRLFKCGD